MYPTQTNTLRDIVHRASGITPKLTAEQKRLMYAHRWGSHPKEDHLECPSCVICRKY